MSLKLRNLKYMMLLIIVICCVSRCLRFGRDEVTTHPTPQQIVKCKKLMYINPVIDIDPIGYKLLGSGIDDAIFFKFRTKAESIKEIFDSNYVDTSSFSKDFQFIYQDKGLKWWDVTGRKFTGGEISLPNVKYMNVGIQEEDNEYVVYIFWHEV